MSTAVPDFQATLSALGRMNSLPDDAVHELPEDQWPAQWSELPYTDQVRAVGDAFIREGLHLAMPSPAPWRAENSTFSSIRRTRGSERSP